ncbi:MAG: TatD family hydrolase [Pseudomonadota bacterium]
MPVSEPVSPLRLIDSHIHLDDDRFDSDRDEVVQQAIRHGVCAMVVPATTADRWAKIQSLAQRYNHVFATHGLHPMFCHLHHENHLQALKQHLHNGVAIGECGLDKQPHTTDLALQKTFFAAQIDLAGESRLPLIIHARNTVEEVILMLKNAGLNRDSGNGVVHSFNGSLQQAHRLIDLNFNVSFGGPVTNTNARKLHQLISRLPLESMIIETDAPDQPGAAHRGQRNEPRWLNEVVSAIAARRSESVQQIATASNHNAMTLFQLPPTVTQQAL